MQYSQESCRPATLLKRESNCEIFKNTYFEEHLLTAASTEQRWAAASILTLFLSSDNLLTGYEQLSY